MSSFLRFMALVPLFLFISCNKNDPDASDLDAGSLPLEQVARMISCLPMGDEQLNEVYDAVSASSGNGYDEEYMMSDLFNSPGSGVGDPPTKAGKRYGRPMRDLISDYLSHRGFTKSGAADVQRYIDSLTESGMQIYWPYSENWDGRSLPIVTFDPGMGAESNYGYELRMGSDGLMVVDSVIVDEALAMERPVWVINRNDDSGYTPFEPFSKATPVSKPAESDGKILTIKKFRMLRNYDSWFAGASEFFIQVGAVDGFRATTEEELKKHAPMITDFMVVVKRKQLGLDIPFKTILLTDYTPQMDKMAFLITEDDGGTTTSWKCSANVKYNSKTYGFDIELPYKDKDDIVWRGQLSHTFFEGKDQVTGRFGDVMVTFGLE